MLMASCYNRGRNLALVFRGVCEMLVFQGFGVDDVQVCGGGPIDICSRCRQWAEGKSRTARTLQLVGCRFVIGINHTGKHIFHYVGGATVFIDFNNSGSGLCHGHGSQADSCDTSDELHFCCLFFPLRLFVCVQSLSSVFVCFAQSPSWLLFSQGQRVALYTE